VCLFILYLYFIMFKQLKNSMLAGKKNVTLIEMVVVIAIIVIIIAFVLTRLGNFDFLANEQSIGGNLKNYAWGLKNFNSSIENLKPQTFAKLFGTDWSTTISDAGWFAGVVSNCKFEPGEFKVKETKFIDSFKVWAVGKDLSTQVTVGPVDSLRSYLSKLGTWRMYFIARPKAAMLNTANTNYSSIGDNVYVVLIEHSKANYADFYAGTDVASRKYYNVVMLDSQWSQYDGMTSLSVLRWLLGTPGGDANALIELNENTKALVNGTSTNCMASS